MRSSPTTTLHRTWITSALQLVAVIVGLGALAVGLTALMRTQFHETTSHVEAEGRVLTDLKQAIVEMGEAATPVLYRMSGDTIEGHLATYQAASERLDASFDAAEAEFTNPGATAVLTEMRQTSHELNTVVLVDSVELLESGVLAATLAAGADPYDSTFWKPYSAMDAGILDVGAVSVGELRERVVEFDRVHRLIVGLVLAAIVLALGMSWLAARRISRRVLVPLSTLREAALTLRSSHLDQPIVLAHAATELQDLAQTMNETSAALRDTHQLLRSQAGADALTGLPNRRAFLELLHDLLVDEGHDRIGVLFIDLDDFKIVNDSLGHAAGDELLRVVARRLRAVAREGETVARLGGDEFAIVLRSDSVSAAAVATAERALASLGDRVVIEGTRVDVGCSIGVAVSPTGAGPEAADELLRNADFAMYMAKSQGKNRLEVFAPTMHAEMTSRLDLKHELGQAARLDQFVLAYQPVVEVSSRALLGFEALIRWQHPTRGLLSPADFIALAEDTGDIVAIGAWVLEEACGALAEHQRRQEPGATPLWMSVNVSPVEILRPGFVDTVVGVIERHGLPPESLMIEITEGVAITDTGAAAAVLDDLRAVGVHIALDDFGTGFSSLRSLHELPIDVIKIDRSFLVNAHAGSDAESLLEMIVALGRTLGLQVIAEGVETVEDLDRLERFDIAGQGYLFARPLSPEDATEFRTRTMAMALPTTSV